MLTTRDFTVIDFLKDYKIATTTTLTSLFFPSLRICQRRMRELYQEGKLKRARDSINKEYIYFISQPKQLRHSLLLTQFYGEASKHCDVVSFRSEITLDNIRPDALMAYEKSGKKYIALIEVEISNKGLDMKKYERFYKNEDYKKWFPVMPKIIIITDKKVPQTNLDTIVIKTDLSDFTI